MFYEKTTDLLDLALWMQSDTDGISISDIMKKYNISKRTAIRMKDTLKEKFPQIKENVGAHNFKRWYIPHSNLDRFASFTLNEVTALQNAVKLMKNKKMIDAEYLESALHKINACMGRETANRIGPDAEALMEAEGFILRPGPKIKTDKKFVNELRNAVIACKTLRIKYTSRRRSEWHIIDPYGFLYGNNHYLIAFDHEKEIMCHFKMNDIKNIEITNNYFTRDHKFSLKEFSERSFGVYQEEPFDVEWLFDKEVAKVAAKYIFHPKQTMKKNKDGTLTVKFNAGGATEMDWHLYTWGSHVKVIKPTDFDERKKWKK